jgi:hypothetical protein
MCPERRRPYFGGAAARPRQRRELAHLGLVGEAGGDANRRRQCEGGLSGRGVISKVAGCDWGDPRRSRTAAAQVSSRRARTMAPGHGKNDV